MTRNSPALFPDVPLAPARARAVATRILEWYDVKRRDLPWRETRDPYAILVSEFMLQQTQVATAEPYFRRFIQAFPSVADLALAEEQEVLRMWAGLGYYSRARNLHAAARKIVAEFDGRVPDGFAELLFLPGVGRYMAGAVASIAFGHAVPAVDANVARIACRLCALHVNPAAVRVRAGLEELVAGLVPASRPGDFNQALMDLGATICTAAAPRCLECPLLALCDAAKKGDPERYPAQPKRPANIEVHEAVALLRSKGRYLVVRRPADHGRYRNMWEFPHTETEPGADARPMLEAFIEANWGFKAQAEAEWAEIRHQVTHHRITKHLHPCRPQGDPEPVLRESENARLATPDEIAQLPLGAPHKKILALLRQSAELFNV